jgi:hypothetical protein
LFRKSCLTMSVKYVKGILRRSLLPTEVIVLFGVNTHEKLIEI